MYSDDIALMLENFGQLVSALMLVSGCAVICAQKAGME